MVYELGRKRENFVWENINKRRRERHKDVKEMIDNGISSDSVCS
jgi:hypothetical protein